MAFRDILTPILGPDAEIPKSETTVEFMNMKFAELLENTKDNRQQTSILNDAKPTATTNVLSLPKGSWFSQNIINAPSGGWYIYNIKYLADGYRYITVDGYLENTGKKYFSMVEEDVFKGWEQLVIVKKIDISSYLANGWVNLNPTIPIIAIITGKKCNIIGNISNPSICADNSVVLSNFGATAIAYRGSVCQGNQKATTPIYITSVTGSNQIVIQSVVDRPVTPNQGYIVNISFDIV